MKSLVITGINISEGGPLTIFYDCLDSILESGYAKEYSITVFVHSKELFKRYEDLFTIIELPKSKESALNRLYYEYVYFNKWSNSRNIDVWFSLHDITPNVHSKKLFTYCHNPMPFSKTTLWEKIKYFRYGLHAIFYTLLYKKNVRKATSIIVQQEWIRKEFKKKYKINNVIVARPLTIEKEEDDDVYNTALCNTRNLKNIYTFFSYPRFFKNFEVICEACRILNQNDFEVWLTLDGTENSYAKRLRRKYNQVKQIKWLGLQARDGIKRIINTADYLIFPSKLETWGLPITEFKKTGKGIILADLPYAHETVGTYNKVRFFNPNRPEELAKILADTNRSGRGFISCCEETIDAPYAKNWKELLSMLLY